MAKENKDSLAEAKDVLLGILASTLGAGPDLVNAIRPGTFSRGTSARGREMFGVPQQLSDKEEAMIAAGSLLGGSAGLAAKGGAKIAKALATNKVNKEARGLLEETLVRRAQIEANVQKDIANMMQRVQDTLFEAGKGSGKGFANSVQNPLSDTANVFPYGILQVVDETPGQNLMRDLAQGLGLSPANIPAHLQKSLAFDIQKGLNKPHAAEISRQAFNNKYFNGRLRPAETVAMSSKSYIPSLINSTLKPTGEVSKLTYQVLDEALKRGLILGKK